MIFLNVIIIFFVSCALIVGVIKTVNAISVKLTFMNTNYQKLSNYRLHAYLQLNKALSASSIVFDHQDKIYHNLFSCAADYFEYKELLSCANKKAFWFSKNTEEYLQQYIETLDKKGLAYGLSMSSDDIMFQEFSSINYEIFDYYQEKLLKSIIMDANIAVDIKDFLLTKDESSNKLDIYNVINKKLNDQLQPIVANR